MTRHIRYFLFLEFEHKDEKYLKKVLLNEFSIKINHLYRNISGLN